LKTLYEGLKLNDLNKRYTHLLNGYARSQSFLETVDEVVQHVKSVNPNALYVCDPVMGDNGKMYVNVCTARTTAQE
jgi:pyridoxine kinase